MTPDPVSPHAERLRERASFLEQLIETANKFNGPQPHWESERRAEMAAERAGAAALDELVSIDAVMARRPALNKPTRRENIEHAITTAGRTTDEVATLRAERDRLRARVEQLEQAIGLVLDADDMNDLLHGTGLAEKLRAALPPPEAAERQEPTP